MNEQQKNTLLIVAFGGVMILAFSIYWHFFFNAAQITDAMTKKTTTEQQIAAKNTELKELLRLMSQKDQMEEERARVDKALRRLPKRVDAPGFIQAIYSVLRETSVIQQSVKPKPLIDGPQYTEIPYGVIAHGRYHEIGQFLTLIEQNPDRFMRIKRLKISNNMARPSIHPFELDVATFMFKDAPPPPPVAAPAPSGRAARRR